MDSSKSHLQFHFMMIAGQLRFLLLADEVDGDSS